MEDGQRYYSYLLRVWLAGDRDQPHWRASLEDTHTGERRGFASLDDLFAFLREQVVQAGPSKTGKEN